MSCPEHETLCAFADDELDVSARGQIEAHLVSCVTCREQVEQFKWLNQLAPSALRGIEVNASPSKVSRPLFAPQTNRPHRVAMAAVVLAGLSIGVWFITQHAGERKPGPKDTRLSQPAHSPVRTDGTFTPEGNPGVALTSDEAFERWARPYRRLRIPLVPMEEVGKSLPPEIPPIQPLTPKPNGTG